VSTKEKRLWKEEKDVDDIKGGYKGKKNHFLNYNPLSFSSQIANINFNSSFPTKKPEIQTNQVNNQTKNILKNPRTVNLVTLKATTHQTGSSSIACASAATIS
jgi:hypothetical protein